MWLQRAERPGLQVDSAVTIQMKAIEQYFPVVLFIMLHKVVLTFESVDEILKGDHWNESYWAVLIYVYHAVQCAGSKFESADEILKGGHLNENYWAVHIYCDGDIH